MTVRMAVVGAVPHAVLQGLAGEACPIAEESPADVLAAIRLLAPDLVLLGAGAPVRASEVRAASNSPGVPLPVASSARDDDADVLLPPEADSGELPRVRAVLGRLARLHRLARPAESTVATPSGVGLERLRTELEAARRHARVLSVVVVAIDHTAELVQTFGPEVLAAVRAALSETLASSLRAADFLVELDGGEILVGLPDTPASGARVVAGRLRTRARALLLKPETAAGRTAVPIKLQTSIGIAEGPSPELHAVEQLVRGARLDLERARAAHAPA